jgi:CheY-like chemotaxis protein
MLSGPRCGHDLRVKLLIVDDSVEMRALMRMLLGDLAANVVECGGGREAVALYFQFRPDWVIMDLQMQNGDGLSATREIRRDDPAARILIVTQFDEEPLREAAAASGAVGYVLKEDLLGIRRVLVQGTVVGSTAAGG